MPQRIELDTDHLCSLYQSGASVLQMANTLGVSRPVITRRLAQLGLKARTASEAQFLRNARYTPEQRRQFTAGAHAACRGVKQTLEHRCKIAATKQATAVVPPPRYEGDMYGWLTAAGLAPVCQMALGPYNLDLALCESRIAVEVFGGHWHATGRHARRFRERTEYILGAGWVPVYIWVTHGWKGRIHWSRASAEYVVSLHQVRCSGEPAAGKEHVIRGDGYTTETAEINPYNGALILNASRGNDVRDDYGRFASHAAGM